MTKTCWLIFGSPCVIVVRSFSVVDKTRSDSEKGHYRVVRPIQTGGLLLVTDAAAPCRFDTSVQGLSMNSVFLGKIL